MKALISENCWKKSSSKMFIREGTSYFSDLIKGWSYNLVMTLVVLLQSMAFLKSFVELMQLYIEMGLENTKFKNVSGWPDQEHYSSAKDLAILTKNLMN